MFGSDATSEASDEAAAHLPTVLQFAAQLPTPDLRDYPSATGPGYHLLMAVPARMGVGVHGLRIIGSLAGLAPSTVWAVELKTLSKAEGETLMAMGRVLYPHKKLPNAVYAILAKDLDGSASGDAGAASMLREGISNLNALAGGNFAKAKADKQLAIVKGREGSGFFNTVRGQCMSSLYNNDMAFAAFGFPGSAWEKGGYITRGFQDLKWLPAPSKEASPPAYLG
jgi:hypothetical protein